MSEVQKELTKAKTNEDTGKYDKAAQNYFKAAQITNDIKLYNKAFFTARKSSRSDIMYQFGRVYYDILLQDDQQSKIKELLPTFLEITGRERDRLADESPEKKLGVLDWSTTLYQQLGNLDAAYDLSLQTGDTFFKCGEEILSATHRIGKEEKWQRGLDLLDNAISAFQQIRLDAKSLEKILAVKLDRIGKLIDIGRHTDGIEATSNLMSFYSSHPENILPYSKEVLSQKIAEIFAEKSLEAARDKKFDIAEVLMNTTKAGFINAGKKHEIAPYLWNIALIYNEFKQKELFFNCVDSTFETALKYKNDELQQTILDYLRIQGKETCDSIINSRMLMVKKGSIEFTKNEGVQYILKGIDLCKITKNGDVSNQYINFLFHYAQNMYTKKLMKRSLPYLEFCAQTWWDLDDERKPQTRSVIEYLESKLGDLLTIGKFDEASANLASIISIKIFIGEAEQAGISAFSFAQEAGRQAKQNIELEFLERAYDAFTSAKSIDKLKEMINYITQQLDPLFNLDSKSKTPRDKLIQLGDSTTRGISEQSNGEFLQATTFKALNSNLIELGIDTAHKAFEAMKKYDPKVSADIYFKVGSFLLEVDMERAIDFVTKSTQFATEHGSLQEVVNRNINYLKEQILVNSDLSTKLFIVNQLEVITNIIEKKDVFNDFLFIFAQDLAKKANQPEYFKEMKTFISRSFNVFHSKNPNHPVLSEIITWTNNHILNTYEENENARIYELALESLNFHEKTKKSQDFLDFFWQIFEKFLSSEDFAHAIAFFKQTNEFLDRMEVSNETKKEFTEKAIVDLDRKVKPKIDEEKFDEAWSLINGLFTILNKAGLQAKAGQIYETNAVIFAPHRLDLALTMWDESIRNLKAINETNIISRIANTISKEIIPIYTEKGATQAVIQLYKQVIAANEAIGNIDVTLDNILQLSRSYLSSGNFEDVLEWGQKGFQLASSNKNDKLLFEFANMFFAVGRGLLTDNPDIGVKLIEIASDHLRNYGEIGFNHYCVKIAESYEDLYNSPVTQSIAQRERTNILQHFKETGNKKEEGNFYITSAKLAFQASNINEGLDLISQAISILKELEDEDGLSEIVSVCLKTAANYRVGSEEYQALSNLAASVQETSTVEISEEKTQEAFTDLFDGLLDDMTSLLDPKEREKRRKEKKQR